MGLWNETPLRFNAPADLSGQIRLALRSDRPVSLQVDQLDLILEPLKVLVEREQR